MKLKIIFSLVLIFTMNTYAQQLADVNTVMPNYKCQHFYQDMLKDKNFEITYAHGYSDASEGKETFDNYYKSLLIKKITSPCSAYNKACGFVRSADDAERFEKNVINPDGNLQKVTLVITHSSISSDNHKNEQDPKQKYQSEHAKNIFGNGIRNSKVVFYDGHSRDGGGPDFSPPKLLGDGHTNYDWYHVNKPGTKFMLEVLKEDEIKLKFLSMFSCSSNIHFYKKVSLANPEVGFIGTDDLLYFSDQTSYRVIDDLLGFRCLDKIEYPAPTTFKKWWANLNTIEELTSFTWYNQYDKRVNNLLRNYMRTKLKPEINKLFHKELDSLTYIPKSVKDNFVNAKGVMYSFDLMYFVNKWKKM